MRIIDSKFLAPIFDQFQNNFIYDVKWRMESPNGSRFFNKWSVCFGLTLVVLNVIGWPSLIVWILVDIGLVTLLILPRILQLIKKTSTRADVVIPGSVKSGRGGFSSAMDEASRINTRHHTHNSEGSRARSSTRYTHEFSRFTPDERDSRTPLPTISAIRNRLSYRYVILTFSRTYFVIKFTLARRRQVFALLLPHHSVPEPRVDCKKEIEHHTTLLDQHVTITHLMKQQDYHPVFYILLELIYQLLEKFVVLL